MLYPIRLIVVTPWTLHYAIIQLLAFLRCASDWYKKFTKYQKDGTYMGMRNFEDDADDAFAEDEKIFE